MEYFHRTCEYRRKRLNEESYGYLIKNKIFNSLVLSNFVINSCTIKACLSVICSLFYVIINQDFYIIIIIKESISCELNTLKGLIN